MRKSRALSAVPLVALVALLAGCAPATAPAATTTPSGAAVSTPTPTPTVAPAAAPGPRVQLKCADLYSAAAVARLINATPTITTDETTAPIYLDDVANSQLGTLSCTWIGPDGTEISASEQLAIQIAPDSAAAYAAHAAADLTPSGKAKAYPSTAGDQSGYVCRTFGISGTQCVAQMLVGSYWVSVNLGAADPAGKAAIPIATVSSRIQTVLTSVAGQLTAAPAPVPRWIAPAATPPAFCSAATSTAQVRSIFGVPGYALDAPTNPYIDAGSVATLGITSSCSWTDHGGKAASFDLELVAGGSWVYPNFHTTPYRDGIVEKFSPVQIAGATGADLGCSAGFCQSTLGVGTTLVSVGFSDLGAAKDKLALGKLAAAISAS